MTYRVAWIGCGRHAEQMLLPQLLRHNIELVAVCDLDASTVQKIGRRYGVIGSFTDYRAMLQLPGIDVVGMAVGPTQHRDMSIAALERGYHVFMEKPTGGNVPDAKMTIRPGYQVPFARAIRDGADIPTGAVGLITEPVQAEQVIGNGDADCVFLARALLRDPYWPIHAAQELGAAPAWPDQYKRAGVNAFGK